MTLCEMLVVAAESGFSPRPARPPREKHGVVEVARLMHRRPNQGAADGSVMFYTNGEVWVSDGPEGEVLDDPEELRGFLQDRAPMSVFDPEVRREYVNLDGEASPPDTGWKLEGFNG